MSASRTNTDLTAFTFLTVFASRLAADACWTSPSAYNQPAMTANITAPGIEKSQFGVTSATREPVTLYTITNSGGVQVELIDYGATIRSIRIPSKNKQLVDVVLGFENFNGYEKNAPYLGSTAGRVCNRIKAGKFTANGQTYTLAVNNGPNHLHGGIEGFSYRLWRLKEIGPDYVTFEYLSPDGEEGYPSAVRVTATFRLLSNPDRLIIEYSAVNEGDKTTPINLTNHAYFNLCGVDKADIDIQGHQLAVYSDSYLPVDEHGLVTGQILPVDGTPYDLRNSALLGDRLDQLKPLLGYDNHFVNNVSSTPKQLAVLSCPQTGLAMTVSSTQPGLQVYTAQYMNESSGKYGRSYGKFAGIALETQHFPDAVNNPQFPSVWLNAGEKFKEVTEFEFRAY